MTTHPHPSPQPAPVRDRDRSVDRPATLDVPLTVVLGDELAGLTAGHSLVPTQFMGKVRILNVSYAPAGADLAASTVVIIGQLPAGALIIDGKLMATGGAIPALNVGTYRREPSTGTFVAVDATRYGSGLTPAPTGVLPFANTAATHALETTTETLFIGLAVSTGNWAVGEALQVFMSFVLD